MHGFVWRVHVKTDGREDDPASRESREDILMFCLRLVVVTFEAGSQFRSIGWDTFKSAGHEGDSAYCELTRNTRPRLPFSVSRNYSAIIDHHSSMSWRDGCCCLVCKMLKCLGCSLTYSIKTKYVINKAASVRHASHAQALTITDRPNFPVRSPAGLLNAMLSAADNQSP